MMEQWLQYARILIENKRVLGMILGLAFGIVVLSIGLLKSLVLLFFVVIGYWVGKFWDQQEDWHDVIERMIPPKYRD
ncbi:MAG: DUF2273 domain-containing protein [Tumebacillaceae bacterium]